MAEQYSQIPMSVGMDGTPISTQGEANNVFTPSLQDIQSSELTKWQLNNNELIGELELRIMGQQWDAQQGKMVKTSSPLMNLQGLKHLTSLLQPLTDKNVILSDFVDAEIRLKIIKLMETINELLRDHQSDYKINKTHLSLISDMFEETIHAALKRAWKGETTKSLSRGTERKEIVTINPRTGGWLSRR